MNPRAGWSTVVIIGLLLAGAGPACDWISLVGEPEVPPTSPRQPMTDAATRDEGPPAIPDASVAVDSAGPADSYDAMCLHYCQALEETGLLACVSKGRQVDDCKAGASTADSCFDLRCRSQRVDLPLCLKQCDSLASFYDAYCPVEPSTDPLCPTSRAEHDAACRAPCVL